jgi:hypothetical protein
MPGQHHIGGARSRIGFRDLNALPAVRRVGGPQGHLQGIDDQPAIDPRAH